MELRHLRYFVALAEELHFGRAAKRLSITQPPLSLNIRNLEEELGVQLLERDSKHVALTSAGKGFLHKALEVLAHAHGAQREARAIAAGMTGRVEIGFSGSLTYLGVLETISRFARDHPEIDVFLQEQPSRDQTEALLAGTLDVGLLASLDKPSGLESHMLESERFIACLPSSHSLARRSKIKLSALKDDAFIMISRDATTKYNAFVSGLCAAAGFLPRIGASSPHLLSMAAMVSRGLGVALLPESFKASGIAGVSFANIDVSSKLALSCYVAWNPEYASPATLNLVRNLHASASSNDLKNRSAARKIILDSARPHS